MATTIDDTNRVMHLAQDQALIDGMTKNAQALTSLLILARPYKPADLIPVLQARIATAKALLPARAAWLAAVQADADERAKTKPLIDGLRQALITAFASTPQTLADFGLAPRKKTVPSPETKAAAAAKAKATRAARRKTGASPPSATPPVPPAPKAP